ncbi:MAG: acyl-CoA synthetase (AMP-forming)/AMP-acid ligase II [Paraglaciecola sp.]|jgi:acyl-CoA synthetase (AMP-forming)/AMP-acid ligase II
MQWDINHLGDIHDLVNDELWSSEKLLKEITNRARYLQQLFGIEKGNFVITHGNSAEFFADLFAVWQIGGCAVCVNPALTSNELANVVSFVEAKAVLIQQPLDVDSQIPVLSLGGKIANSSLPFNIESGLDDPALILFTSGTTGDPKGVVHTHRSLQARIALNQHHLGIETLSRTLCVLPSHFGHGLIGNCLTPLLCGGKLFLNHGAGIKGTAALGQIVDQHQITFMSSVPSFWKIALRISPAPQGKSLQRINIGSAPLSADLWNEVIAWSGTNHVANMYGITETANWIGGALASEFPPEDGLLGKTWGGTVAVKTSDGELKHQGEGEILIQVPSLMQNYYRRPDLTSEVLKNGWYHSGDIGTLDAGGLLRMTGRTKYAINLGGIKIYPEELDLLLERHPEVDEACAFAIADSVSGEVVAAAIKLSEHASPGSADLANWLSSRIRVEAQPRKLFYLDDIPKTDRGKLNRDNVAAFCKAQ